MHCNLKPCQVLGRSTYLLLSYNVFTADTLRCGIDIWPCDFDLWP